jgi:hypothetical protein
MTLAKPPPPPPQQQEQQQQQQQQAPGAVQTHITTDQPLLQQDKPLLASQLLQALMAQSIDEVTPQPVKHVAEPTKITFKTVDMEHSDLSRRDESQLYYGQGIANTHLHSVAFQLDDTTLAPMDLHDLDAHERLTLHTDGMLFTCDLRQSINDTESFPDWPLSNFMHDAHSFLTMPCLKLYVCVAELDTNSVIDNNNHA